MVNIFVQEQKTTYANNIKDQFSKMELGDSAIENAGDIYTGNNLYKQVFDYIKSIYKYDSDEDESCPNEIVSQLATLFTYIKSYGNGDNNRYKDLKTEDDKYLYYNLIQEESSKIKKFWNKIILEYKNCELDNCINDLTDLSNSFDQYAIWPAATSITINSTEYKLYLFTNMYKNEDTPIDVSIGDYDFPEDIDFPDIPDEIEDLNEDEVLEDLNDHELDQIEKPEITILTTEYWQKYFTLATLICLVPTFWNCGLDIMPFIQFIRLPCIFKAIKCVHISMFNMVIVFGIALRGMYFSPIILYLNTSDSPISILTPLVSAVDQIKTTFNDKINKLEVLPIKALTDFYINKLTDEINEIKKENIKLDNYKRAIKRIHIPKASAITKQFGQIVNPNSDFRQNIMRLETLVKKSASEEQEQ